MIEIENNRLYWNNVKICYAQHEIHEPFSGNCYISYSHRHQRNLILCAGKAWMGSDDGSLPAPDIVIGSVVGPNGLLSDHSAMEHLMSLLQAKEDDGLNVRIVIK